LIIRITVSPTKDIMSIEGFRKRDANGDKRLTLEELLNSVFHDFEIMDVDKNGALSMEEIDSYVKATRE
jgi:hypothetical protein